MVIITHLQNGQVHEAQSSLRVEAVDLLTDELQCRRDDGRVL